MRYSRIISQSLYRRFTPNYQNPTCHLYQSISSLHTFKNFNFAGKSLYFAREFTSESKTAPSERVSSIVDEISGLTLLELSYLTEILVKKLDIKEMPAMAVMMPGMGFGMKGGTAKGGGAVKGKEKVAEKTAFDLKLEGGFDASAKIKIIKEVRACTDLGLKEAKDLVEKAPALLKKGVSKEEGEKIIAKLEKVGAKVIME